MIAALSWPLSGFGLGLGEIIVESTLASPLKASIPLSGMDRIDLDPDQFFIRISGISKPKIQYRLERTDTGTASINLYTRKAVTEPLFQFSIEVEWDEGTVARRYDVLIDPPSYHLNAPVEAITTSDPDENPGNGFEPIVANPPATSPVVETAVTSSDNHTGEPVTPATEARRQYGPIVDGDSIWRVAKKVATGSKELSIYQWMYGIWKANPQAFARSNMHRLRTNEFIGVPYEREIAAIPWAEAYQTYTRHLALFETAIETVETVADDDPAPRTVVESAPEVERERLAFEELPVAVVEKPPVTTAAVNIEKAATPVVVNSSNNPAIEVLNEGEVILDLLEVLDAGDQSGIIIVGAGANIEVPTVKSSTNEESRVESSSAFKNRSHSIEQLPVIGSGAPLTFLGRALQQTDEFVSTRPGWWIMAFGVWITLVILMLSHEIRSRPGLLRGLKQRVTDLVLGVSTTRELIPASAEVEDSFRKLAMESESDDPTEQPDKINSKIDEVMAEADVLVAKGNPDKAMELLEASMDIQPDQGLTIHMLEAYHKAGDAKGFETLVEHFKTVIEAMDSGDQIYVQAMYSELCPNSTYLIDAGYLKDPNIMVPAIPAKPERPEQDARPHMGEDNNVEVPVESDPGDAIENDEAEEEDDFLVTQVIIRENKAELPAPAAGVKQQDDTLDEVDIYLAYGLYENAEDLLIQSMEARPGRADYTSKLLDTYFATRNAADFTRQAEALKRMGDAANRYWDRVQVMGYELAPDNELFSGARDSSLSASDLGIAKPQVADFDLGSEIEDDAPIAKTDFPLSEDSNDLVDDDVDVDTQSFIETVNREGEVVEDEEEVPTSGEAADDPSDYEIIFDAAGVEGIKKIDGATRIFELPDEINVGDDETGAEPENMSLELPGAEEIVFESLDSGIFDLADDTDADGEEIVSESEYALIETSGAGETDFGSLDTDVFELPDDMDVDGEKIISEPADASMETGDDEEIDFGPLNTGFFELPDDPENNVDSKSFDGRILYFPVSHSDEGKSGEFESEVKMTLQSIRDQMQQINERMFSQERDSNNLKKAIGELNELSNSQLPEKSKKSKK
jgi:FimV-like protein